ncbi:hypothetical protein R1sor_025266 [Riccia sorocarpa]|uniref:FAS1 domain-containing protein n=1 Tax=Riccia sorocarpa TaxID=122646 RepID=A0ABD3G848_9MARC
MALIRSRGAAGGFLVGALLLLSVACTSAVMVDLAQVLAGAGGFSEIIKVAQNANRTQWPSAFTFFAPNNGAVKKFACLKDPSQAGIAGRVLQYHMLTAAYPISSIQTRTAKGPWMAYTALAGQRLNITSKGSKVTIVGNGVTAKLSKADIVTKTTQVVHGIDKLFIPANINSVCGKSASGASATGGSCKEKQTLGRSDGNGELYNSRALLLAMVVQRLTTELRPPGIR